MSDKTNSTLPSETETDKAVQINESRRRMAKAGVVGSGVILTLASRSVLGGWGVCTGSEIMSGNLSKPGEANPCGCSPGYWGNINGYNTWMDQLGKLISSNHAPDKSFNTVFGVSFFKKNLDNTAVTLLQAVRKEGIPKARCGKPEGDGSLKTAAFHAVAALMNASVYGSRYPVPAGYQTPTGIITNFLNYVTACNLDTFVRTVDVYTTSNMWCFGSEE